MFDMKLVEQLLKLPFRFSVVRVFSHSIQQAFSFCRTDEGRTILEDDTCEWPGAIGLAKNTGLAICWDLRAFLLF